MSSPVEDRLRDALAEAGASVDASTLRPLRAPERRRSRVDFRMLTAAAAVVLVGSATAVLAGGGLAGDDDRTAATAAEVFGRDDADLVVFLCTATVPKDAPCAGAVTPGQREAIEHALTEQAPRIAAAQWVSQETSYDEFRRRFAHDRALLDEVKVTDVPASYQLKLQPGADPKQVERPLSRMAGVLSVIDRTTSPAPTSKAQEWDVSVFLCKKETNLPACRAGGETKEGRAATLAQTKAIQKLIQTRPEVAEVVFEDEEAAFRHFKESFANNKALLEATRVEDMPQSFRIKLKEGARWGEESSEALARQPGVAQVMDGRCVRTRATLLWDFGLMRPDTKMCAGSE
ncbi:hypothetical protein GCM10009850_118030 [Nonomuraea monospora]|uniref:FtsX extracellular domain-containing protein n=1 Tax=Nonomuraea monospora TaxID=568818 RepID=A0ABN3D3G1_9ACTN